MTLHPCRCPFVVGEYHIGADSNEQNPVVSYEQVSVYIFESRSKSGLLWMINNCAMNPLKLQNACWAGCQISWPVKFIVVEIMKFRAIMKSLIPSPMR
jgi:hypothetical protein